MFIQILFYLFLFFIPSNLIIFISWRFVVRLFCLLSFIFPNFVAFYDLLLNYLDCQIVFYFLILCYLVHLLGFIFLIVFCLKGFLLVIFLKYEIIFLIAFMKAKYLFIKYLFHIFPNLIVIELSNFLIIFILSFYFLFYYSI